MLFHLPISLSLWLATASFISSLEWIFEQHHAPNKVTEALISGILPEYTIDDYNVTKSNGNQLIIMPSTPRSLSMNELMGFVNALDTVNSSIHFSFRDSVEEDFLTLRSVPMAVLRSGIDYTVQLSAVTYPVGNYCEEATNFDCEADVKDSFKINGYIDIGQPGSGGSGKF